jgi:hypothetical protein
VPGLGRGGLSVEAKRITMDAYIQICVSHLSLKNNQNYIPSVVHVKKTIIQIFNQLFQKSVILFKNYERNKSKKKSFSHHLHKSISQSGGEARYLTRCEYELSRGPVHHGLAENRIFLSEVAFHP